MPRKKDEFYLGKIFDLKKQKIVGPEVHYPSEDLTTHGVCLGMTGSGKTGLSICLLEEAALSGIPSIVLDVKGDLTNLMLSFPELADSDFAKWIPQQEAAKSGITVEKYAEKKGKMWRDGLADWGIDANDIERMHNVSDFRLHSPGSNVCGSLNILGSFAAPDIDWDENAEEIRDRISTTVSAILSLVGFDTDPISSTEHVFLSNLFEYRFREGISIDFNNLIHDIKTPPIENLGALDVNEVFPEKDRKKLMVALNNVLAAPSFKSWIDADDPTLDIESLISDKGKPVCNILYLAHLSEEERMFFITLLLDQIVSWMRAQPGSGDLRLLVYFDEIFGYIPSHPYNPPSKKPLSTIIKQGRAFGVGVLLSAQNPGDLDYKMLSNCGTWFIGRLTTQRDKDKVLEGLDSIGLASKGLSRKWLDKAISSLQKRVFILQNSHDKKSPHIFHTRWAMSYLRGPMTKDEIKYFKSGSKKLKAKPEKISRSEGAEMSGKTTTSGNADLDRITVDEYFLRSDKGKAKYKAAIYVNATANFQRSRPEIYADLEVVRVVKGDGRVVSPRWDANVHSFDEKELRDGRPAGELGTVASSVLDTTGVDKLYSEFEKYAKAKVKLSVLSNKALKIVSEVGESREEFLKRCDEEAEDSADKDLAKLKSKYEKKLAALEKKIMKEETDIEKAEARMENINSGALTSIGGGALSILFGKKGRKLTGTKEVLRGIGKASRTKGRKKVYETEIDASEELIETYQRAVEDMEDELTSEVAEIERRWDESADSIIELKLKPKYIEINEIAILWLAE